jgi:N-acetylglucosaminyldiphosphoundecaprenol N-acetyl-beta-D-mannosaminyltransferase
MRTSLLDTPVDVATMDETVACALAAMRSGRRCQHVALNVAKLVNARSDAELAQDIRDSDIVGIDGMGIVYGLRATGQGAPERVAGIDLFLRLMAECADRGFRPFLLGARPDVLADVQAELLRRFPDLKIAGSHHGYFGPDEEERICGLIRESRAHCLFVAMPTPRKERFMRRWRESLGVPFLMGVGGSFDVVAGRVTRAPRVMQRFGLEWLHRLLQEPRKMSGRYVRTNAIYAVLIARELLRRSRAGGPAPDEAARGVAAPDERAA